MQLRTYVKCSMMYVPLPICVCKEKLINFFFFKNKFTGWYDMFSVRRRTTYDKHTLHDWKFNAIIWWSLNQIQLKIHWLHTTANSIHTIYPFPSEIFQRCVNVTTLPIQPTWKNASQFPYTYERTQFGKFLVLQKIRFICFDIIAI